MVYIFNHYPILMKICLIGLPSSGKSSIVNSLCFKRVSTTGISRTTLEPTLYESLKSDDGIDFDIIDLPGINDTLDMNNHYDKVAIDTIRTVDLVIWVSDVIKAFTTSYEKLEFERIRKHIKEIMVNEGISVQLIILLSKMDMQYSDEIMINRIQNKSSLPKKNTLAKFFKKINISDLSDEIDGEDDTTIYDNIKNIKDFIKDIDVVCFNAHGRSYHSTHSSVNLKKHIAQYSPS